MERNSYSRIVGECKFYLKFVDSDRGKNRGILFTRKVHVNWNVREGFTSGKRRESRVNRLFHHSLCARHEFYLKFVRCKGDKNSFFFGKDSSLSKKADFIFCFQFFRIILFTVYICVRKLFNYHFVCIFFSTNTNRLEQQVRKRCQNIIRSNINIIRQTRLYLRKMSIRIRLIRYLSVINSIASLLSFKRRSLLPLTLHKESKKKL